MEPASSKSPTITRMRQSKIQLCGLRRLDSRRGTEQEDRGVGPEDIALAGFVPLL